MYRELVEKYSEGIEWVKIQKPATRLQIVSAELAVGHRFPKELTNLLSELNGDRWLLFSTDDIIETVHRNKKYLEEVYPTVSRHIFFAGNGCGDYFCYNISENNSVDEASVFMWDHETDGTHKVASSITELIERYYRDEI